ncbi:MAG: hypothetical protein FJZ01_26325 [Candidatus Sericytochromatia bacterium]|nr:hypothetical protein [Candidatus Tanganyikabacteria bacterium]
MRRAAGGLVALLIAAACSRLGADLAGTVPETPAPDAAATAIATVSVTPTPVPGFTGIPDFSTGGGATPTATPDPTPTPLPGDLSVKPSYQQACRPLAADADCPSTASFQAYVADATVSADGWAVLTAGGEPAIGATISSDGMLALTDGIGTGIHFIQARLTDQRKSAVLDVKK